MVTGKWSTANDDEARRDCANTYCVKHTDSDGTRMAERKGKHTRADGGDELLKDVVRADALYQNGEPLHPVASTSALALRPARMPGAQRDSTRTSGHQGWAAAAHKRHTERRKCGWVNRRSKQAARAGGGRRGDVQASGPWAGAGEESAERRCRLHARCAGRPAQSTACARLEPARAGRPPGALRSPTPLCVGARLASTLSWRVDSLPKGGSQWS